MTRPIKIREAQVIPVGAGSARRNQRRETVRRCATTWATVYGIARLGAMNQIPAPSLPATEQLRHDALSTLHHGWNTPAPRRPA